MGETKSSGIAAILSFLWPGAGQLYNGEFLKGALLIILAIVFALLILILIGIPLFLILWIYAIYDGYKGAERYNAAHRTRQCMRCGAQIAMSFATCPHCGNPIPGMQPTPYQTVGFQPPGFPPQQPQWQGMAQPAQFQNIPPTNPFPPAAQRPPANPLPPAIAPGQSPAVNPQVPRMCSNCGAPSPPGAAFCGSCGVRQA